MIKVIRKMILIDYNSDIENLNIDITKFFDNFKFKTGWKNFLILTIINIELIFDERRN